MIHLFAVPLGIISVNRFVPLLALLSHQNRVCSSQNKSTPTFELLTTDVWPNENWSSEMVSDLGVVSDLCLNSFEKPILVCHYCNPALEIFQCLQTASFQVIAIVGMLITGVAVGASLSSAVFTCFWPIFGSRSQCKYATPLAQPTA